VSSVGEKNTQPFNVITAGLTENMFSALCFKEIQKLKPQIGAISGTQVFNYLVVEIRYVM